MADQKTVNDLLFGASFILDSTPLNNPDISHILLQHDIYLLPAADLNSFLKRLRSDQGQESLRALRDAIDSILES